MFNIEQDTSSSSSFFNVEFKDILSQILFLVKPLPPPYVFNRVWGKGGGEVLISITSLLWSRGNMMFSYTATVYAQNTKYPARVIESKYDEHPLYVP